ncbi:MAG: hypothetical protein OJF59_002646 [Cytophagales bacterium]|nr:MAG: hypothetical protein OJF59_002646 [Cytophagales bacterium]
MTLSVVFIVFVLLYLLLMRQANKFIPIIYLALFTYYIQYIFSVYLIYNEYPMLERQMPLRQEVLFGYLIPAVAALFGGALLFKKDIDLSQRVKDITPQAATRLGHLLLIISLSVDVGTIFIPSLESVSSFTNNLKYGAFMCYTFSLTPLNIVLMFLIFSNLLRDALIGGIFIDFFMWCTMFFMMFSYRFQFSDFRRYLFILIAFPVLILIQSIKQEYRYCTYKGKKESGLGTLTELAIKKQEQEDSPFTESSGVINTVARLNQGWHVAKVMKHVPSKVPFSNGEDFLSDLKGVILPRVLFPEKKIAGDHSKFEHFTGHILHNNTSMTVGVLGDYYLNFGYTGALVGLFIFGAVASRAVYWFTKKYVVSHPINIIWIPVLFGYMVRANNDFYTVINSMFKGFLIFLFVQFLLKAVWPEPAAR